MFNLEGKTAVVTGSARGIGKVIVRCLAQCGARVMMADINEETLGQAEHELREEGLEVAGTAVDVGSPESLRTAMKAAAGMFGRLDILVNCAGILGVSDIEEMTKNEWNRVLDINLGGTFFACQAALPYLKESGAGRIINISSLAGRNGGFSGSMSYVASKGGVISITRGMAKKFAQYNITVNAVCPGTTETEMLKGYSRQQIEFQLSHILMRRLGKPEEIAAAVCYLASDEAGFVTGVILDVNGGAYFG